MLALFFATSVQSSSWFEHQNILSTFATLYFLADMMMLLISKLWDGYTRAVLAVREFRKRKALTG